MYVYIYIIIYIYMYTGTYLYPKLHFTLSWGVIFTSRIYHIVTMGLKPAKKWLEFHHQHLRWGAARFPVDFPENQSGFVWK